MPPTGITPGFGGVKSSISLLDARFSESTSGKSEINRKQIGIQTFGPSIHRPGMTLRNQDLI